MKLFNCPEDIYIILQIFYIDTIGRLYTMNIAHDLYKLYFQFKPINYFKKG